MINKMNSLATLKKFLGNRPHSYEPNLLVFSQLDEEKLKEEYRVDEVGRERGEARLPNSDAIALDGVEAGIVTRIEKEKHQWYDTFQNHLSTFQQRLGSLNSEGYFSRVRTTAREAIGEFKAEILKRENDLSLERQYVIDSRTHLAQFRERNGLIRPPNYPDSKTWHFALVLVLCLVEAVMNGFFLALENEFGLFGGLSQAVLIAMFNVGVAFVIGRFVVTEFNHVRLGRRMLGLGLVSCYVVFVVAFNLAVAHYRDALELNAAISSATDMAAQKAVRTFIGNPLAVQSFQSWIMVGIGGLFAFIACVDGYRFGDRYPGYERESRRHRDLYEEYSVKVESAVDALRDIRDSAVDDMEQLREDLAKRRAAYDSILANRVRFINQFRAHLNYLEMVANHLLTTYRTANRRARGGDPAPSYFDRPWIMTKPEEPVPTPPSFSLAAFDEVLNETDSALEKAINELYKVFEESLPRFKRIDDLN